MLNALIYQATKFKKKRGYCKCPKKPGGLNMAKISAALGGTAWCMNCHRKIKPENKQ